MDRCQLPVSLNFEVDMETSFPIIKEMPYKDVYDTLGVIIGVTDYSTNLASFWLLDIIAEALMRAQLEFRMTQAYQRILIAWFGFTFNHVRESLLSREEIFRELECKAQSAGTNIVLEKSTPTGSNGPAIEADHHPLPPSQAAPVGGRGHRKLQGAAREIVAILEILYDIFANPFAFSLVKTAFTSSPEVIRVEYPYTIHFPKKLKRTIPEVVIPNRNTTQMSAVPEYIIKEYSLDLTSERSDDSKEYILPLKDAVTQEFIDRIFSSNKILNK